MPERRYRNRAAQKTPAGNGKLFIQIIICIAIICTFMVFKDTTLPNGRTPRDYADKILSTTVNIPEIIARFSEEAALPAGAEIKNP